MRGVILLEARALIRCLRKRENDRAKRFAASAADGQQLRIPGSGPEPSPTSTTRKARR